MKSYKYKTYVTKNQRKRDLKKYDISDEQYKQLSVKQNNRCAICSGLELNLRYLCIDHNHRTGKVRGLLCHKCNTILGFVNEDVKILQNAIKYLKRNA